jgi:hypothetical protein
MKVYFDPILNKLRVKDTTGGGGGGSNITVVTNYSSLPSASTVSGQFYWCSQSQGTSWLPGSLGGTYYNSGLYYSNGTSWEFLNVPYQATQVEVDAGVIEDKFVSPATLAGTSKWGDYLPLAGGTMDSEAVIYFNNNSKLREGITDAALGGNKGIALVCSIDYELKWEAGRLYIMEQNGFTIREVSHNFTFTPTVTDDNLKGFVIGSRWVLDNGNIYICSDAATGAAVWDLFFSGVPTKTSELINDGDDGNPFISLNDLPSNLILYATTAASDIPTYVKLVSSITDPSYNTVAVNVSTGSITTTNQFISALITSPNVIVGNPGVINISTIGNIRRTSGTGDAEFYFEVYKRDSAGTETLIATSGNTPPVFNGVYAQFSATALWNDGTFLSTDRIVLKFYGSRVVGGSNPTYDFQFGGSTPVRSLVPLPLTVVPVLPQAISDAANLFNYYNFI